MTITEPLYKDTTVGRLHLIYDFEDYAATLEVGSEERNKAEKELLRMYKEHNTFIGTKIFNETKIDL